jgi:hypothetical protein
MPEGPSQGNQNPGNGDGAGAGNGNGDGNGGTPPAGNQNPQGGQQGGSDQFDPTALTQEQINQVLEKNPLIWKADRIAGLRDKASKFDKAEQDRQTLESKALEEQGKFKELSEKQASTIEELQGKLKTSTVNQALTNKLAPLGVVDLEAALALVDRSKIEVSDDGAITGLDEAIETLKTGKAYLFNKEGAGTTNVGTPSNPGNGGGTPGPAKFKRSQLQDPKFYQEHRDEILKAQAAGQIEDDVTR